MMCITEYDEVRAFREEREEGRREGRRDGTLNTLIGLVKKGRLTIEEASEEVGMTVAEFQETTQLNAD